MGRISKKPERLLYVPLCRQSEVIRSPGFILDWCNDRCKCTG